MRRVQRYHVLSVFGDMKAHNYNDSVMIGSLHIANPVNRMEIWPGEKISNKTYYSVVFENMLKECFGSGLLQLVENERTKNIRLTQCYHSLHPTENGKICISYQISPRDYDIQLTAKGRECLGLEQVERSGDYSWYGKSGFDGTIDKASKISPNLFKG